MTTSPPERTGGRATIVGLGLMGGSVAAALRARSWVVSGVDLDPEVMDEALRRGIVDSLGLDEASDLVVVATPVRSTPEVLAELVAGPLHDAAVLTDLGSVKGPLVRGVDHPRFVGGHPMAGSEQVGLSGADAELFVGATWVLTPTPDTDPEAYSTLRAVVTSLGANVVDLAPDRHDAMVAVVSHVPHLTAASLMMLASELGEEHGALLQLAAGGFRDMTRVAAGSPTIWPDICADNAEAIVSTLDLLVEALVAMRERVARGDRQELLHVLGRAASARRALNDRVVATEPLSEIRIPVPDRVGVLHEVTVLVSELGVNIVDLEIAHSVEGDRGVLVVVVAQRVAASVVDALATRGYRSTAQPLGTTG